MHQAPLGIVIRTDLRVAYVTFGLEVAQLAYRSLNLYMDTHDQKGQTHMSALFVLI
jgi:hypothetical protein